MELQNPRFWIRNFHVKAAAMRNQPSLKRTVCLYIPKPIFGKLKHYAIHKNPALWRAGNRVIPASLLHGSDLAAQHVIQKPHRVGPPDFNGFFRHIKNYSSLAQTPILFDCVLASVDRKISICIDASHHFGATSAGNVGRFLKPACADCNGILHIRCFLEVTHKIFL